MCLCVRHLVIGFLVELLPFLLRTYIYITVCLGFRHADIFEKLDILNYMWIILEEAELENW